MTSNTQVAQTALQACPTHLNLSVKPTVMTSALIGAIVLDIVRIWKKLRAGTHYIKLDQTRIQCGIPRRTHHHV
ncbi:MAG: hypothetical protein KME43_25530 [Myxacorys chilensis ATA2-1-KO14]|nr:hypothetical protein [Myxacorys chilensis ATA2-1-KO14]